MMNETFIWDVEVIEFVQISCVFTLLHSFFQISEIFDLLSLNNSVRKILLSNNVEIIVRNFSASASA